LPPPLQVISPFLPLTRYLFFSLPFSPMAVGSFSFLSEQEPGQSSLLGERSHIVFPFFSSKEPDFLARLLFPFWGTTKSGVFDAAFFINNQAFSSFSRGPSSPSSPQWRPFLFFFRPGKTRSIRFKSWPVRDEARAPFFPSLLSLLQLTALLSVTWRRCSPPRPCKTPFFLVSPSCLLCATEFFRSSFRCRSATLSALFQLFSGQKSGCPPPFCVRWLSDSSVLLEFYADEPIFSNNLSRPPSGRRAVRTFCSTTLRQLFLSPPQNLFFFDCV